MFDYFIDSETKQFVSWTESLGRFELDPDVPLQVIIILFTVFGIGYSFWLCFC